MDALLFGTTAFVHVYLLRMGNGVSSREVDSSPSRLLELSMQGDLPAIISLLNRPSATNDMADFVNQQDANGNAAIHGAVFGGHLKVVEYLVANGASLQLCNTLGCSPLWLASGYNHPPILEFLSNAKEMDTMLTKANNTGDTPLIAAASKGFFDVCKLLIDMAGSTSPPTTKSLLCAKNKSNDTALSVALGVGSDNVDLFSLFYDESILNTVNAQGLTPLLIACERDLATTVRSLVDSGADTCVTDTAGHSILAVASFCGSTKVVDLFLNGSSSVTEKVRPLLNAQSTVSGCTPLWLATRAGHTPCVHLLLAAGADRDIANQQNLTPLQAAQKYHQADMIELLSTGTTI